jgi:heparin binding hemagglutinin HbhA
MAFSAPEPDEARTAAEPTTVSPESPRSPLLAALGAGEAAFAAVAHAFAEAFTTAASTQKTVQQRVADLPTELEGLRGRFTGDELRKALEAYRAQVERAYSEFAVRGEETWGRLREQPQVRQTITTVESYGGKLDGRVDVLVDDAQDAAARALAAARRQTRVTGEKVARAGQRFSGRAADVVVDASAATSGAVEETGAAAAGAIEDVGEETAAVTRRTTRKAAPRRAPRPSGPTSD